MLWYKVWLEDGVCTLEILDVQGGKRSDAAEASAEIAITCCACNNLTIASSNTQYTTCSTCLHVSDSRLFVTMASTQALTAASADRKARLAQLKSLKRKQPEEPEDESQASAAKSPRHSTAEDEEHNVTAKYLSGRNYDAQTKGAKLGFESTPAANQETLEAKAATLAQETKRQAEEEEKADKPLDLFKLQPKKPNWDLKRDLERKLEVLNARTDNAIAMIVRERIQGQQKSVKAQSNGNGDSEGAAAGVDGVTLVEATNVREREDEEDARRERDEDEALLEET